MYEKLKMLPGKQKAKGFRGQKQWGYWPKKRNVFIKELILWGMPVQPETDHLFAGSIFDHVYHFYSEDDLVQRVDFVSTKKGYSDQRFDRSRLSIFEHGECEHGVCHLVQSRVMVGRNLEKCDLRLRRTGTIEDRSPSAKVSHSVKKEEKQESIWSILFSDGALVNPKSKDPTHKELWFFSWYDEDSDKRKFALEPFPVSVFSPLFVVVVMPIY